MPRRTTTRPSIITPTCLSIAIISAWLATPHPRTALAVAQVAARSFMEALKYGCYVLVLSVLPLLLVLGLCTLPYSCLVRFQDFVSDYSRRRRFGDNSRNLASSLPPEVQLRVFRLLQHRGRFGLDPHSRDALLWPYPPTRDLRAVVRVCRSWHGAGTEILYDSIWLPEEHTCILFADTLAARPALARLVHHFALPSVASYLPRLNLQTSYTRCTESRFSPLWKDVKSSIDRIIVLCVNASDVQLCGGVGDPEEYTGLMQCLPRTKTLSLMTPTLSIYATTPEPREDVHLQFPSPILRLHLGHLQELTLSNYTLDTRENGLFLSLITLRLISCKLRYSWFVCVMSNAPNLRALDWRDTNWGATTFLPPYQNIRLAISDIVGSRSHVLTRLNLTREEYWTHPRTVTLGNMSSCSSLRTLEISTNVLPTLDDLPPLLETLILLDVRDLGGVHLGTVPVRETQKKIFAVAARIKHSLTVWKLYAPHLHTIQLWDTVDKTAIRTWTIAAFLLHAFLSTWDVSLVVNVRLDMEEEIRAAKRAKRRKFFQRLLWRGVI